MTRDEMMDGFRRWPSYERGKDGREYVRAPEFMGCWTEIGAYADYMIARDDRFEKRFKALNDRRTAQGKRRISRKQYAARVDNWRRFRSFELVDVHVGRFYKLYRYGM